MSSSGTAYYLYCLTPCACGVPASAIGVDGQPGVMVRDCGGIGAVFSQVELGEFCGESADAHLQDLAWLGPRVCRHEAVIEEIMSRVPVLPARFATLFTSVGQLGAVRSRTPGGHRPGSSPSSATNRSGPSRGC